MPEMQTENTPRRKEVRHRDRVSQMPIYLGKLLRSLVYQNDWKVLPMSAIVAAIVSMVVGPNFFVNMEGTMMGSFALTCVCIWNGCFNSIQSICRERSIVKREHRSGMHVFSYVSAHLIYQAMLCLAQTVITIYVARLVGVRFPAEGLISRYFIVDMLVTVFLVTYASDLMALFVSSIVHSTTAAMTVMPFLLIFQLVFSGGFFTLPGWATPLTKCTVSHYGLCSMSALGDYNGLPLVSAWNSLIRLKYTQIDEEFTIGEALDLINDESNPSVADIRGKKIADLGFELEEIYNNPELVPELDKLKEVLTPAGAAIENFARNETTLGELADALRKDPGIKKNLDKKVHMKFSVNDVIQLFGEDSIREIIQTRSAAANYYPDFEHSAENLSNNWTSMVLFSAIFALLCMVSLKFIDKDKR